MVTLIFLTYFRVAMKKLGESLSDKELEDMMKQADIDGDGKINYEGTQRMLYSTSICGIIRIT